MRSERVSRGSYQGIGLAMPKVLPFVETGLAASLQEISRPFGGWASEVILPSKKEIDRRYNNIRSRMQAAGLDALIVCGNQYAGFEGAVFYTLSLIHI